MGWEQIPWYTLTDDFDADLGMAELHGTNAFFRDGERIFRTYFINDRGDEALGSTFSYFDGAVAEGLLDANPAERVVLPRCRAGPAWSVRERRYLTRAELVRLLD